MKLFNDKHNGEVRKCRHFAIRKYTLMNRHRLSDISHLPPLVLPPREFTWWRCELYQTCQAITAINDETNQMNSSTAKVGREILAHVATISSHGGTSTEMMEKGAYPHPSLVNDDGSQETGAFGLRDIDLNFPPDIPMSDNLVLNFPPDSPMSENLVLNFPPDSPMSENLVLDPPPVSLSSDDLELDFLSDGPIYIDESEEDVSEYDEKLEEYMNLVDNETVLGGFDPRVRHHVIETTFDVKGDGHCGFRCCAELLGMSEDDGWAIIRQRMFQELQGNRHLYQATLGETGCRYLEKALPYYRTDKVPNDYWMQLPEMGCLFANTFNCGLCVYSPPRDCQTYLPFTTAPEDPVKIIHVVMINGNHFIKLRTKPGAPIPPITPGWVLHNPEAIHWVYFCQEGIDKWGRCFG